MFGRKKRAANTDQVVGERGHSGRDADREKQNDEFATVDATESRNQKYETTKRALKSRHLQLIALGG